MSISRRKFGAMAAAITATPLALSACSTMTSNNGGETEQVMRYSPDAFPQSLDAHYYPAELAVYNVAHQVLEPLTIMEDGEPTPALAESWDRPDENTWVFTMREAEFSDGTPLTANDAQASIERILELGGPITPLFADVDTVKADDESTLTITTSTPLGALLNSLSMIFVGKGDSIGDDVYWRSPIGTGPFVVDTYTADESVTLTRNDSYWGEAATLDRVEIVNMPEVSSRITALTTGEIDAMLGVPPDQIPNVDGVDGLSFAAQDSYKYVVTWFNHNSEPLDDVRVRQALTYAVDLEALVTSLYGDAAAVMTAPLTQAVFGAPALEPQPYDPELAKELLAEAGHADGLSLNLIWPNDAAPNIQSFAQGLISGWAEIGVTIEPFELERAQWSERFDGMDYDLSLFENVTTTGDAGFTLGRLYTCEADRMGYCDEELDELLTKGSQSVDQAERETAYKEASSILWRDAVSLWAMALNNNYAVRGNVEGFTVKPTGMVDCAAISITPE